MRLTKLFATLAACCISMPAFAAITDVSFVGVDNSSVPTLADYVTTDVLLSGTGQLTTVEILAGNGTAGTFYQDGFGGVTAPNHLLLPGFPSVAFDTFVSLGKRSTADAGFDPSTAGGAVDIGGSASGSTFSDSLLDIGYFPAGGSIISDPSDYFVARLTVSSSYSGPLELIAFTGTESYSVSTEIVNGVIGGAVDPVAVPSVADGTTISVQSAFSDYSGLLEDALTFTNSGGGTLEILSVAIENESVAGIFGASEDGLAVDLTLDLPLAYSLPPNTVVTGDLRVSTNGGDFSFPLTATVPEPSTVALAGLALVGLVGFARRK